MCATERATRRSILGTQLGPGAGVPAQMPIDSELKRTQTVGKCAGREFFRLGYEQDPAIDQGQQMKVECALAAC